MSHTIICRAKAVPHCIDGHDTAEQFWDDLPMSEDGTFDGSSIICDPCYMALMPLTPSGRGLNHETDHAIALIRRSEGKENG